MKIKLFSLLFLMLSLSLYAVEPPPYHLVVLDYNADPQGSNSYGSVFMMDPEGDPESNATFLADSYDYFWSLTAVEYETGRKGIVISDAESDPSGYGEDPNIDPVELEPGHGHGAILRYDPVSEEVTVVSDGSDYAAGIPNGEESIFVDPFSITIADDDSYILADPDADPSDLGNDFRDYYGYGAIFKVDPDDGAVTLVSDGTLYSDPGTGRPSIFEDPYAVDMAPDGSIIMVDFNADPLDQGYWGGVFRIDPGTGEAVTVSSSSQFEGLFDVTVAPDGTIYVLDTLADPTGNDYYGAIFKVDPNPAEPLDNSELVVSHPDFTTLVSLDIDDFTGLLYVADQDADPLGEGHAGAVFVIDPASGTVDVASSTPDYVDPMNVSFVNYPFRIVSVEPDKAQRGDNLVITINGWGEFTPSSTVSFEEGVNVNFTTFVDSTTLTADVTVDLDASIGTYNVTVDDPLPASFTLQDGFNVVSMEVTGVSPQTVFPDDIYDVTITGNNFRADAIVDFGQGITAGAPTVVDEHTIEVQIDVDAAAEEGPRTITVTNQHGTGGNLPDTFAVVWGTPTVDTVTPSQLPQGITIGLTMTGSHLSVNTVIEFDPPDDLTVGDLEYIDPGTIIVEVSVAINADLGFRDLIARVSEEHPDLFSRKDDAIEILDNELPWQPLGDLNHDYVIDGYDLGWLGLVFGIREGEDAFYNDADLNNDAEIDGDDVVIFMQQFARNFNP